MSSELGCSEARSSVSPHLKFFKHSICRLGICDFMAKAFHFTEMESLHTANSHSLCSQCSLLFHQRKKICEGHKLSQEILAGDGGWRSLVTLSQLSHSRLIFFFFLIHYFTLHSNRNTPNIQLLKH